MGAENPAPSIDPPDFLPYIRASNFPRPACRVCSYEELPRMANTPGSKKAVRKIARRTEVNTARRSRVRTYLRKFDEALTSGDAAAAKDAFVKAQSELMRAVTKGVVHKNTGSRKVSRLAAQLKKMAAA
jgi:small subunit ribosomal protein S20